MGQALTVNQAGFSTQARRSGGRRKLAPVPALDWPADLFSDNVSLGELLVETYRSAWDEASFVQHEYSQAA